MLRPMPRRRQQFWTGKVFRQTMNVLPRICRLRQRPLPMTRKDLKNNLTPYRLETPPGPLKERREVEYPTSGRLFWHDQSNCRNESEKSWVTWQNYPDRLIGKTRAIIKKITVGSSAVRRYV
jgi:hypothetical protein